MRTAKSTVQAIVDKFKKVKTFKTLPGRGRRRKERMLLIRSLSTKCVPIVKKPIKIIHKELIDELTISLSERTIRCRLNEAGFRGPVARKNHW